MKNAWVDKLKGQRLIFYLFVGYIFLFLFWWCYLLYTKISEIAQEKLKLHELLSQSGTSELESQQYLNDMLLIESRMHREHIMIIAEGITFFIILLFVAFRLRKSINKELEVARQQKNFMLSITHELKSPIASASLNIETLSKRQLDEEKKQLLLSNSAKEIKRLNELVNKILLAAKMESDFLAVDFENVNLSKLIEEVIEDIKEKEGNNQRLNNIYIQPNISIKGDKTLLKSLSINLIDNALKYSNNESPVELALTQNERQIIFKVIDNGKGISDKDKMYIFEKFYRAGDEETRTSTGTGLGLYLVKQIVNIHKGNILVTNNTNGKGTTFEVSLQSR